MRVLFICKKWIDTYGKCYGLINSASFVANMLNDKGIEATMVSAIDNNCIDREVHKYKPTHVIIEAIWVVPSKFEILMKLHPKVKWIVRIHSKIPFLAMEGNAFDWIQEYISLSKKNKNFKLSFNVDSTTDEVNGVFGNTTIYLPNIYYPKHNSKNENKDELIVFGDVKKDNSFIDIACFGAIRPLKNQLIQAIAAIHFATKIGKKLRFHINATREEQQGQNVLKNLKSLFLHPDGHELVQHGWMTHSEFINVVKSMDLGMQVSLTESFNIVAADFAWNNIPIVTSPEISWINSLYKCSTDSVIAIVNTLNFAWKMKSIGLQYLNKRGLKLFNEEATTVWLKMLNKS